MYQIFSVAGSVLLAFAILDSVKKSLKTGRLIGRESGQGCKE